MQQKWTRAFLWISVTAWGFLVGAKVFDLVVLVGAWSAAPPESLRMLPYGPSWPVDTGDFFIPSSAALLIATLGALVAGWRTPLRYRLWLALSLTMIFGILLLTVSEFWPLNSELWRVARHAPDAITDRGAINGMVHRWVRLDRLRVAMGLAGFFCSIKAISQPFPALELPRSSPLAVKLGYVAGIASVVTFVFYFLSKL